MAKTGRMQTPPSFAIGDKVYVKPSTIDPDFPDILLGGWAGTHASVQQSPQP